jgi:hypothetical protein
MQYMGTLVTLFLQSAEKFYPCKGTTTKTVTPGDPGAPDLY